MNSSKPTPGIKNKEASAKNPLYMVPTLFASGKLFWTQLFLKLAFREGLALEHLALSLKFVILACVRCKNVILSRI